MDWQNGLRYGIYIPSVDDFIVFHIDPVVFIIEDGHLIGAVRYKDGVGTPIPFLDYDLDGIQINYMKHFQVMYPFQVQKSHHKTLLLFDTEEEAYLMKLQSLSLVRTSYETDLGKLKTEIDRKIPATIHEEYTKEINLKPEFLL